eukprot:613858-Alexandrium_andersonii.AAC.1
MPPEDLCQSGWVGRLGANVSCPAGVASTCTSGAGRLLDYFVLSPSVAPWSASIRCTGAPLGSRTFLPT